MTATPAAPGILLATFGITTRQSNAALAAFTARTQAAFPGHEVRWAFTTRQPKNRQGPDGEIYPDLATALSRYAALGMTRIVVQPLHLVAGQEHEELRAAVAAWAEPQTQVRVNVGRPLLVDAAAAHEVFAAMQSFSPELTPGTAAVWVGHGGKAPGYAQLAKLAAASGQPIIIGFLSSHPTLDDVRGALVAAGTTTVCLRPFFALPGHHAASDVGGTDERSWKSQLEAAGIHCQMETKGLVEHEAFAHMWLARLRDAAGTL